ncbi:unnamed protein product [Pseudo-nitzschia multistriata]|uniref:Uncharacterized protein n=1 Tax=Pseudo-nitzschia multistriata TaxID=183589 RepID=A0A448YWG8_9STRA|nr:unnamed protein product [Pseudo-nitzschia multistriata]
MTQDGKKRRRSVDANKLDADKQAQNRNSAKKKAKKEKKSKKNKKDEHHNDSSGGINNGNDEVNCKQSSSLMDSIFGAGSNTGSGSVNAATKTKSSSLMDSIFNSDNSTFVANKTSSSTAALFDSTATETAPTKIYHQPFPQQLPERKTTPKTDNNANNECDDDADLIRKTLHNRKIRSEHRPLMRKALDFPGVFHNEEADEGNGFFLLDDENERAKETADAVRDHGLCIIRKAIDPTDSSTDGGSHPLRDVVLPAAKALQRKLNKALKARNIHHSSETFRFREAASRCRGRTDVVFDEFEKDESMIDISRQILRNKKVYPVIKNLLGAASGNDGDSDEDVKLVYAGLIFSYPNSCDQPWHQDGTPLFPELPRNQSSLLQASLPPYALNVFLPLEDEDGSIEKGPTEFLPNSHKWESPDERLRMANLSSGDAVEENVGNGDDDDDEGSDRSDEDDEGNSDDEAIIAPVLKCGDALIYDYRVCHRGTANLFGKFRSMIGSEATSKKKKKKKKKREQNDEDDVTGTRRILYLMYARPWFTDHVNFDYTKSAESLFDYNKVMS